MDEFSDRPRFAGGREKGLARAGAGFECPPVARIFQRLYEASGQPWFNYDRAQTSASMDRFKHLAKNLNATVIIQHDRRDIDKLPAFPAAAR